MGTVKEIVCGLTGRFGTCDPFLICENMDILVVAVELPPGIKGFYTALMNVRIIYLNSALADERERRAVCAHELGHAVLHTGCNSLFLKESTGFVCGRFEREADLFAGYLLLEESLLEECRCNDWTTGQISRFTGLPEAIVECCID